MHKFRTNGLYTCRNIADLKKSVFSRLKIDSLQQHSCYSPH